MAYPVKHCGLILHEHSGGSLYFDLKQISVTTTLIKISMSQNTLTIV